MNIYLWIALAVIIAMIVRIGRIESRLVVMDQRLKIFETRSYKKYENSRTYNQQGEIVATSWTDVLSDGYWVTIKTDAESNIFAEHSRTDEKSQGGNSGRWVAEEKYNREEVYGKSYKVRNWSGLGIRRSKRRTKGGFIDISKERKNI